MTAPAVSVLIPVLNDKTALEELLRQLRPVAEACQLIVCDGGSVDGSQKLVRDAGLTLLVSEPGRSLQMNTAAAAATGAVLWFLHADTRLQAPAASYIDCVKDVEHWGFFGVHLSGRQFVFRIIEAAISWRSRLTGVATGDQGIFVRSDLFQSLGGYASIPLMEDVELSKRLRHFGRAAGAGKYLLTSSRRWEHHGVMRTILLMWRLRLAYWLGTSPKKLASMYYGS